ncbi:MAG: HK97 gp10 family phage protein [Candidatus Caldarchaeum sp.]
MNITVEFRSNFDVEKAFAVIRLKILKALKEAATAGYAEALHRVPVRTGLLKSSITLSQSPFQYIISAGWPTKEKGRPYYAPFVEWGTRRMAPRPFMRPAAEKVVETLKALL